VILTAGEIVEAFDRWHVRHVARPGWATRHTRHSWDLRAIYLHHDANHDKVSTERGLAVIEEGRPDLAGPLSNSWNEDDGTVYLTALGNTNNAGRITQEAYDRITKGLPPRGDAGALRHRDSRIVGNTYGWAIEIHNAGDGRDPYEPGQMQSTVLECAAICDAVGRKVTGRWGAGPSVGWGGNRVWAHRQLTPRKIDPLGIVIVSFAEAVDVALYVGPTGARPTPLEDDMPTVVAKALRFNPNGSGQGYVMDAYGALHPVGGAPKMPNHAEFDDWIAAKVGPAVDFEVTSWGPAPGAVVLDAVGGRHPAGSAPTQTGGPYWAKGFVPPAPVV